MKNTGYTLDESKSMEQRYKTDAKLLKKLKDAEKQDTLKKKKASK